MSQGGNFAFSAPNDPLGMFLRQFAMRIYHLRLNPYSEPKPFCRRIPAMGLQSSGRLLHSPASHAQPRGRHRYADTCRQTIRHRE